MAERTVEQLNIEERMGLQKAEFDALDDLIRAYKNMPAVVDDDYRMMRHYYETALTNFIGALNNNRRFNLASQ
jgi:hypothetical protein